MVSWGMAGFENAKIFDFNWYLIYKLNSGQEWPSTITVARLDLWV